MMSSKPHNTNYDILDKILVDSDREGRQGQRNGKRHLRDADGNWIVSEEEFAQLNKSIEDIEKYLRS